MNSIFIVIVCSFYFSFILLGRDPKSRVIPAIPIGDHAALTQMGHDPKKRSRN